jgi:hypothetical protein
MLILNGCLAAVNASVALRNARTNDNTVRFTAAEYLTETQICALFPRWSTQEQKHRIKRSGTDPNTEEEENPINKHMTLS